VIDPEWDVGERRVGKEEVAVGKGLTCLRKFDSIAQRICQYLSDPKPVGENETSEERLDILDKLKTAFLRRDVEDLRVGDNVCDEQWRGLQCQFASLNLANVLWAKRKSGGGKKERRGENARVPFRQAQASFPRSEAPF
jgi:hypothetical protein